MNFNRPVVIPSAVAATVALFSLVVNTFDELSTMKIVSYVQIGMGALIVPGLFISTLIGGNIHDDNPVVAAIVNALLYYFIVHFFLRRARRKKQAFD